MLQELWKEIVLGLDNITLDNTVLKASWLVRRTVIHDVSAKVGEGEEEDVPVGAVVEGGGCPPWRSLSPAVKYHAQRSVHVITLHTRHYLLHESITEQPRLQH